MAVFNKRDAYGWVAILLHWLLFLLIVGLVASGKYAESITDSPKNSQIITIHQQMGIAIFTLVLLSILWRFVNDRVESLALGLIKFISFFVHWILYLVILGQVCIGIGMSQLSGIKVSLFGWELPAFFGETTYRLFSDFEFILATVDNSKEDMAIALNDLHGTGAWAIVALVGCHVVLVFFQLIASDADIFKRMWFAYTSPHSQKKPSSYSRRKNQEKNN